jgi:hypothetical protein
VAVRKFLHAGQPSYPRTLDLEADPAEELRITLQPGARGRVAAPRAGAMASAAAWAPVRRHGARGCTITASNIPGTQRPYDYGPPHVLKA